MSKQFAIILFLIPLLVVVIAFVLTHNMVSADYYQVPTSSNTFKIVYVGKSPEHQARLIDLYIKIFSGVIVSVSAFFAAFSYFRNGRLERAKWLSHLHEKFFAENKYGEIRMLLDYKEPIKNYDALKVSFSDSSNFSNADLQEKLIGYLNFFEFIATLEKEKQLDFKHINMTFGYYLSSLKEESNSWVYSNLSKNGFTNLPGLVERIFTDRRKSSNQ